MKDTCKVKAHTRNGKKVKAHERKVKGSSSRKKSDGDEYASRKRKKYPYDNPGTPPNYGW